LLTADSSPPCCRHATTSPTRWGTSCSLYNSTQRYQVRAAHRPSYSSRTDAHGLAVRLARRMVALMSQALTSPQSTLIVTLCMCVRDTSRGAIHMSAVWDRCCSTAPRSYVGHLCRSHAYGVACARDAVSMALVAMSSTVCTTAPHCTYSSDSDLRSSARASVGHAIGVILEPLTS